MHIHLKIIDKPIPLVGNLLKAILPKEIKFRGKGDKMSRPKVETKAFEKETTIIKPTYKTNCPLFPA